MKFPVSVIHRPRSRALIPLVRAWQGPTCHFAGGSHVWIGLRLLEIIPSTTLYLNTLPLRDSARHRHAIYHALHRTLTAYKRLEGAYRVLLRSFLTSVTFMIGSSWLLSPSPRFSPFPLLDAPKAGTCFLTPAFGCPFRPWRCSYMACSPSAIV